MDIREETNNVAKRHEKTQISLESTQSDRSLPSPHEESLRP